MSKQRVTAKVKQAVATRAHHCCEYCRSQVRFALQAFSMEHIKPFDAGGKTTLGNLALACEGCNAHKHTKTQAFDLLTGNLVSLFNPRRQKWHKHLREMKMKRILLDQDIRPLSELGPNALSFIEQVRESKRPIVITQDGKSAAVLLDVLEYEALLEKLEILQDVHQAEIQLREGKGIEHESAREQALARLNPCKSFLSMKS